MKEKLSTKEVCPKKVIDCNAVILKKRPLKSIEKDPNLQKVITKITWLGKVVGKVDFI